MAPNRSSLTLRASCIISMEQWTSFGFKPVTDVAKLNADFACDLLSTKSNEQVLEAIITLAMSDIPCTLMVHLQWFTPDYLLAMATRNIIVASFYMGYQRKGYAVFILMVKIVWKLAEN